MSYTLALGLFEPAWHGPQRLVLTITGERVTDVTYRAGYNERGSAERLPRLRLEAALHLVSRLSAASSHAHTLAFCQALEALLGIEVGARAGFLRSVLAEVERASAHLRTVAALFAALGQPGHEASVQQLRRHTRTVMHTLCGQPAMPDMCMPGGVRREVSIEQQQAALTELAAMEPELFTLLDRTIDNQALLARTVDVGVISSDVAVDYGLRGPLARAAGLEVDTRLDEPYAAYDQLSVRRIAQDGGDVHARLVLLLLEAFESTKLATEALGALPPGPCQGDMLLNWRAGQASAAVEAPRGLLRYTVHSDGERLSAVQIDPPRGLDRLLARTLFLHALVDNVLLIALSTNTDAADAEP